MNSLFRLTISICVRPGLFIQFYSFFFYRFSFLSLDFSDIQFPSVSACPSLASSPVVARRDSILKHAGSVKNTDRRVSINQPIIVEYMSEKRPSGPSPAAISVQQSQSSATSSSISYNSSKSSGRPASLVLMKNDRPTVKLIRTPSFDQDQDETSATNSAPSAQFTADTARHMHASSTLARDDDDEDESIPLVQPADKECNTKITNSNYT